MWLRRTDMSRCAADSRWDPLLIPAVYSTGHGSFTIASVDLRIHCSFPFLGVQLEMKRRHRMDKEPVGEHAPVDLAGRTPLAWSARRKRQDIEEELFALGDPSIFPSVPLHR